MALKLVGSSGNLFNSLGKVALLIKQLRSYQGTQLINITNLTNLVGQFSLESDVQAIVGGSYIGALNGAASVGPLASQVAQAYINRQVYRDNARLNQTLQQVNIQDSIFEMVRQMRVEGQTVLAMTITATPTAFTGTGNGVIVMSTKRPLDGLVLENSFQETLWVTCIADSYIGGTLAGNEGFLVNGQGAQTNPFAFDWPLGSNGSIQLNAIDGSKNNTSGNLLNNSDFETWIASKVGLAGAIQQWNISVGPATVTQETGLVFSGKSALKITGDGATKTALSQQFNSSSGTVASLLPQTQYAVNLWLRRDAVAAGAGTLAVELVDQNNNIIQDVNSVNNQFTIDLTQLTTNYVAYNGVFRTPEIFPPASYFLQLRETAALTNGRAIYIDKVAMGQMQQVYPSGPFIAIFSGNTPFSQSGLDNIGDYASVSVTNSRGAAGTLDTFQTALARLIFPLWLSNEYLLPSSSTPSISDQLIN